jgi:hypothetical protein
LFILTRIGLLRLTLANVSILVTVSHVFIFVANDSLGLPLPRAHNQRHITAIIIFRALLTLRKPAQQPLKVLPHAQPRTSRKLQCPTHMNRAHDPISKTPNPAVRKQSKVQFAQRDHPSHKVPRELHDERVQSLDRFHCYGFCYALGPRWV